MKDNSSTLRIGHECVILKCSMSKKPELDQWWRSMKNMELNSFPYSLQESEDYIWKTRWNLINHNINKLYILSAAGEKIITVTANSLPNIFICCDPINDIEFIYIYKYLKHTNQQTVQFEQIGSGKFWSGCINLEPTEIISHSGTMCFPFDSDADMLYLAIHDDGESSGLDSRYGFGNHSSEYFCLFCQINDKNKLSKQGTA